MSDESSTVTETSSLVRADGTFDPDALLAVRSFDDLESIVGNMDAISIVSDVLGDGFSLLSNKMKLIDVPFVMLGYRFNMKLDHPNQIGDFVSVYVMTSKREKYIFNDGSTGIFDQVATIDDKIKKGEVDSEGRRIRMPLMVKGGLRESSYTYEETDPTTGEVVTEKPAQTFYLNTDALVETQV